HPVCPNSTSNTKELFNRLLFDTIEVVRIFGEPPPIGSVVKILRVNKDAMEATQHVSEATFGNIFVVVADPARTSSSAKKRDFALEKGLTPVKSNGVSRVILLDQHVYTKSSEKLYSDTRPTESQIAVIQHNGY